MFSLLTYLCSGMKENIPGLGEELENQEMEEEEDEDRERDGAEEKENDKLALLEETKAGFQLNKLYMLCTVSPIKTGRFEIVELTRNA